jgi:hypothetical protein
MKTQVIQSDPSRPVETTGPAAMASPSPRRTGRIVAGALMAAVGVGTLVGGGALVTVHATQRDGDGFYTSQARALDTPSHALVSEDLDVGTDGPDWLLSDGRLGDVRVAATGRDGPVFVGIAPRSDVDAYLGGVAHEVTDFDGGTPLRSIREAGTATPAPPASQGFWAESASGTGRQTVVWPLEKGDWAAVVMNADGTARVRAEARVGVRSDVVLWLGVGMLVAGGVLAGAGTALIVSGRRRPPRPPEAHATT